MNTTNKRKRTQGEAVQLSLTINGVTVIKQNVRPNGEYFGVRYILPPNFRYEDLLNWRVENATIISQFRKQPKQNEN
jgi:hypothetical protein